MSYTYKLGSGVTITTERKATPVADWLAEGKRRFGAVPDWKFKCPVCGREYTITEFMAAGGDGPNSAYQECIGRHLHAGPFKSESGNANGCDWCAYGLFGTAGKGRVIIAEDGDAVEVFCFAGEEEETL